MAKGLEFRTLSKVSGTVDVAKDLGATSNIRAVDLNVGTADADTYTATDLGLGDQFGLDGVPFAVEQDAAYAGHSVVKGSVVPMGIPPRVVDETLMAGPRDWFRRAALATARRASRIEETLRELSGAKGRGEKLDPTTVRDLYLTIISNPEMVKDEDVVYIADLANEYSDFYAILAILSGRNNGFARTSLLGFDSEPQMPFKAINASDTAAWLATAYEKADADTRAAIRSFLSHHFRSVDGVIARFVDLMQMTGECVTDIRTRAFALFVGTFNEQPLFRVQFLDALAKGQLKVSAADLAENVTEFGLGIVEQLATTAESSSEALELLAQVVMRDPLKYEKYLAQIYNDGGKTPNLRAADARRLHTEIIVDGIYGDLENVTIVRLEDGARFVDEIAEAAKGEGKLAVRAAIVVSDIANYTGATAAVEAAKNLVSPALLEAIAKGEMVEDIGDGDEPYRESTHLLDAATDLTAMGNVAVEKALIARAMNDDEVFAYIVRDAAEVASVDAVLKTIFRNNLEGATARLLSLPDTFHRTNAARSIHAELGKPFAQLIGAYVSDGKVQALRLFTALDLTEEDIAAVDFTQILAHAASGSTDVLEALASLHYENKHLTRLAELVREFFSKTQQSATPPIVAYAALGLKTRQTGSVEIWKLWVLADPGKFVPILVNMVEQFGVGKAVEVLSDINEEHPEIVPTDLITGLNTEVLELNDEHTALALIAQAKSSGRE